MLDNQCKQIKNLSLWSKVIFKLEATSVHPKEANDVKISRVKSSGEHSTGQQGFSAECTNLFCFHRPFVWPDSLRKVGCLLLPSTYLRIFCFLVSSFLSLVLYSLKRNSSQSTKNVSMVKFSSPKQKENSRSVIFFL